MMMNRAVLLAGMFAGLSNVSSRVAEALAKIPTPFIGSSGVSKGGNTKRVNRDNESNHKWDFIQRDKKIGYGVFKNRTTGETSVKKIAQPKTGKPYYQRPLTVAAQKHFGLI